MMAKARPRKPKKPAKTGQTVMVNRKSKVHWRSPRGTLTEAELNEPMQQQADLMKKTMPRAKEMLGALKTYMEGMMPGSLQVTIGSRLAKELREQDYIDYKTL